MEASMEADMDESNQEGDFFENPASCEVDDKVQSVDESYIHVFLLKYVCPKEECGGTMAPLFGSDRSVCNMCSHIRSEQEFMEEMEQYC